VSALALAAAELEEAAAEDILRWTYSRFERVAIVASFQAESTVLIDMACQLVERPDVVTLDTGRLPQETHDQIDRELTAHSLRLHVEVPDPGEVATLTAEHGANPFYRSIELRRRCCEVRKTRPLARALGGFDAWVTGLRREQTRSRAATPVVSEDQAHGGIAKVAPLARWSEDQVWTYLRARRLEYHELYDRGYRSIGCAPCTRAVGPEEDPRAGRWWWEREEVKECGLHWAPEHPTKPAVSRGPRPEVGTS
jgi:thioredoxin-dependent adenylylsulfate APS reductase